MISFDVEKFSDQKIEIRYHFNFFCETIFELLARFSLIPNCAAGAISKECKRVSVPEVLFKQLLKRIDRTVSDSLFWATCGRRAVFEVENR